MDNSKLRQSKDNFYKKVSSSKGFTHQVQPKAEIYQTLIQMLKSDLLLVQDMIVSNSSDIKMYKILSKNPNLVRKLSEIEENPDIKPIIEKIAEASGNAEKISKNYNCSNANELIKKLHLELGYNELLNKKLCDFFILMKIPRKLTFAGDEDYSCKAAFASSIALCNAATESAPPQSSMAWRSVLPNFRRITLACREKFASSILA